MTTLFVWLVVSPKSPLSWVSPRTGVAALFGLSNLYLGRQAVDYFGPSEKLNLFTHT